MTRQPGDQPPAAGDQGRQRDSTGSRAGASCASELQQSLNHLISIDEWLTSAYYNRADSIWEMSPAAHRGIRDRVATIRRELSALTLTQERLQEENARLHADIAAGVDALIDANDQSPADLLEGIKLLELTCNSEHERADAAEQLLSTLSASLTALRDKWLEVSANAPSTFSAGVYKDCAKELSALLVREEP